MNNLEKKICIVTSGGGHLFHLLQLKEFWKKYQRFWVAPVQEDVLSILAKEKIYWSYHPVTRNYINLFKNTYLAFKILRQERPDLLISSGGGVAIPFFYLAKYYGIKTIFIEIYDSFEDTTITGKLVYQISDFFFVQHASQQKRFYKAEYLGPLFMELP